MGLFPGEKVISGMSLGRKHSMYGSFKRALGKQFRGFHVAAWSLFIRGLQLRMTITFLVRTSFWVFLNSMKSPLSLESIHI